MVVELAEDEPFAISDGRNRRVQTGRVQPAERHVVDLRRRSHSCPCRYVC